MPCGDAPPDAVARQRVAQAPMTGGQAARPLPDDSGRPAEHGFGHIGRSAEHGFGHIDRSAEHGFTFPARSAEHGFEHIDRSAEHGFTLVELMVVLAIIGIVSGAVVLAMPDPRGDLRHDAERFAARARAAQDKAVIEARDVALLVTPDGYGFERRDHGVWRVLTDKPFDRHRWTKGATALVGEAGQARALFDPTGIVEPLDLTLVRDAARVRVRIGADGTIDVAG